MSSYSRWADIRAEHVERAGGEEAVKAGKQELLNEVSVHRMAEAGPRPRPDPAAGHRPHGCR